MTYSPLIVLLRTVHCWVIVSVFAIRVYLPPINGRLFNALRINDGRRTTALPSTFGCSALSAVATGSGVACGWVFFFSSPKNSVLYASLSVASRIISSIALFRVLLGFTESRSFGYGFSPH